MGKAQRDYTFSDVIRLRPKWVITRQTDEEKYNRYTDQIASMIENGFAQLAFMPFKDLFDDINCNISSIEFGEINRRVREYLDESKPVALKRKGNLNMAWIRKAINEDLLTEPRDALRIVLEQRLDKKRALEEAIIERHDNIRYHLEQVSSYKNSVRQMNEEVSLLIPDIEDIEERLMEPSKLSKARLKVLKNIPKHWRIVDVQANRFTVIRVTPIHCSFANRAAGISKTVDLGFMGLTLKYNLEFVSAVPVANNIVTRWGSMHPHLRNYICWGNKQNVADRLAQKHDSEGWFRLLDTLLENYDPGNPFVDFNVLHAHRKYGWQSTRGRRKGVNTCTFAKYPHVFDEILQNTDSEYLRRLVQSMRVHPTGWTGISSSRGSHRTIVRQHMREAGILGSDSVVCNSVHWGWTHTPDPSIVDEHIAKAVESREKSKRALIQ
jgi:hypothetical protein